MRALGEARIRWLRAFIICGAAFLAGSLTSGVASAAATPGRVGWWNAASAGGVTAPSPTTPAGGMRIEAAGGQVTAFGAMLFNQTVTTAVLRLRVASKSGSPAVQACPATNDSWNGGDDQAISAAPGYDCTTAAFRGTFNADASIVSFSITGFGQAIEDQLDLVIVPAPNPPLVSSPPFVLDIAKPGPEALTPARAGPTPTGSGSQPATPTATTPRSAPPAAPPRTAPTSVVPLLGDLGSTTQPATPEPAPVVAPANPTPANSEALPVASTTTGPRPNKAGLAAAAVLLAAAGWIRFFPPAERK
jgi:hypothetical protein